MNPLKKMLIGGALVASTITGGAFGAAVLSGTATAQTSSTTASTAPSASAAPRPAFDSAKGGHVGANNVTEALLTGDAAAKANAAALAAVPGGTVQRVENDAEGAVYEAHMLKSDGTPVTVKMDGDFKVTGIETGGPGGPGGHRGPPPAGQPTP